MNVAVSQLSPVDESDRHPVPLAVAGTVHGRPVELLVATLPDVLTHIARWAEQDPAAIGCWGLRSDYSIPLTLPLRQKAGAVRESRRTVHLIRLLPGEAHGATVTALCGERLRIIDVDVLPVGVGMPCGGCLASGLAADRKRDRIVVSSTDTPAVHS